MPHPSQLPGDFRDESKALEAPAPDQPQGAAGEHESSADDQQADRCGADQAADPQPESQQREERPGGDS
jgi:hypothetical protein